MTPFQRLRRLLPALAIFAFLIASAGRADAGTLHVRDEARVLASSDVSHLRAVVDGAPFDARLVVTGEYADARALSRYVGSLVAAPNLVVVGLDPEHHRVEVQYGTGVGIARSEWGGIEHAGNESFRRADWEGGVAAIFRAAAAADQGGAGSGVAGEAAPVPARSSVAGPLLLVLLLASAIGVVVYFARRRSAASPPFGTGGEYGPGPAPGPYGPTGYPGGYPMGPPRGGMGALGGGLLGAGLGGVAGYELGKLEAEREERSRDRLGDDGRGGRDADDGGNFDAGGGGSSWDDAGGGGDGGGGFDGGGGGDGGGFDGGGGGSDF